MNLCGAFGIRITEMSGAPGRRCGYHLIIYDFRRINRSINEKARRIDIRLQRSREDP
jgi:hypothetical protein